MRMNERYYIGTGELQKMYTLRVVFSEPVYVRTEMGAAMVGTKTRDWHVRTLSNDAHTAIMKAKELCGKELTIDFTLGQITRGEDKDYSVFRFGKHFGKEVEVVCDEDPNYVLWVVENFHSKKHQKTIDLCKKVMGDRIREMQEAREAERFARDYEAAQNMNVVADAVKEIADRLLTHVDYGFAMAIGAEMKTGLLPKGKGIHLVADCMGKELGRRNSKKYKAEYQRVYDLIQGLQK